jgi:hypothetical protein
MAEESQGLNNITKSISSLSIGVANAQTSTASITETIKRNNTLKKDVMKNSQSVFEKRREAIRRREQESIIEASSLSGAISRSTKIAAESTKGFLGRIMDFMGSLIVAWAIKNLPIIVNVIQQVLDRSQKLVDILGNFVKNVGGIFTGMANVLGAISQNLISLDFFDSQGKVSIAVNDMQNSH